LLVSEFDFRKSGFGVKSQLDYGAYTSNSTLENQVSVSSRNRFLKLFRQIMTLENQVSVSSRNSLLDNAIEV